jgi:alpha-galactosidase/6-phospho-beta-glucosidase family protein
MGARIAIIGGGSYQWVPKLVVDMANTPSLHDAHLVLEDVDPAPIPRMVSLVEHVARLRGIGLSASGTTDQREALSGADFVVVSISTGGFESMRQDLEVPARYGIRQSVGDTVGPGGICRALRNIPVLVGIARDMEELCPEAWLLNLTNPMTTLCRAVTSQTSVKTAGLCHEVTVSHFVLSLLLDANFLDMDLVVSGVNHLPVVTELRVGSEDGLEALRSLLERAEEVADEPLAMDVPDDLFPGGPPSGGKWTKGELLRRNRVKMELFRRFGALPAAGDRHVVEFFPGFLTEESGFGARWGVPLTTIEDRERGQAGHVAEFEALLGASEVSEWPSGELVAPLIDSLLTGTPRAMPLNLPNQGQVPDLPEGAVAESMCWADSSGVRPRDRAPVGGALGEQLRRVSASQELCVQAALSGERAKVLEAMLADPLASRIDFDLLVRMSEELVSATSRWLPQF